MLRLNGCRTVSRLFTNLITPRTMDNNVNKKITFVSRTSPVTGKVEWIPQDENYDYIQEIARSAYADMLHDTERNRLYYVGVRAAVRAVHARGQCARVLDIGTGTGLLSMMAAAAGADTITACEAFEPMAACARRVIEDNKFSSHIKLVPKRSTDLTVGPDCDLEERANILVTEVYDTELIGEGAIPTFHHAHQCLLTKDVIVVPIAANMYVQLVTSPSIRRWNQFSAVELGEDGAVSPPPDVLRCPGSAAVHDLQLTQLTDFTPITQPLKVFRFDYSGRSPIEFKGESRVEASAAGDGPVDAVFMWWDLQMDTQGDTMLSCAPKWAHPTPDDMQWRDHWMQAVYYPSNHITAMKGEKLLIDSYHDDYSLWFDVAHPNCVSAPLSRRPAPVCECGVHLACSRSRLAMINDPNRNEKYVRLLKQYIRPDTVCLSLGDSSLLPIIAAKLGAKQVYTLETHPLGATLTKKFAHHNKVADRVKVLQKHPEELTADMLDNNKITLLISDAFFHTSLLPWHSLYLWYARTELHHFLQPPSQEGGDDHSGAVVLPQSATLRAIAVELEDLWKIRAPVGNCEGFDLGFFDRMIENASDQADAQLEPHPLWEYPSYPRSDVFSLMAFDIGRPLQGIKTSERKGMLEINGPGWVNAVIVWMDFALSKDTTISTGLQAPPKENQHLQWDPYSKQAVHLLRRPIKLDDSTQKSRLCYKTVFRPSTGDFEFEFKMISSPVKGEKKKE